MKRQTVYLVQDVDFFNMEYSVTCHDSFTKAKT